MEDFSIIAVVLAALATVVNLITTTRALRKSHHRAR